MSAQWTCDVHGCTETTTKEFGFVHWYWQGGPGPDYYFCPQHNAHISQQVLKYLTRVHEKGLKMPKQQDD